MNQTAAVKPTPVITLIGDACNEILANRASLPSMPDVAFRIQKAMKNPDWSIGAIASIIKSDPGTTTYLLRMANSALYASVTPITEIEIAISRLGMESTRNLVTAHVLRSMYVTNSPMLGALMKETWETSARLAAVSAVLAGFCPHVTSDRALLAGLLQDIGVLPILNVLKAYERQISDETLVRAAVERYASRVGMVLLMQWGFEPDMVDVAKSRADWHRDPRARPDLADVVLIARLHERIVRGDTDVPALTAIPAYAKLPVGDLCENGALQCLHDSEDAIRSVMRTLGAG